VVGGRLARRCVVVASGVVVDCATAGVVALERPHALRGAAAASIDLHDAPCRPLTTPHGVLVRADLLAAAAAAGAAQRTLDDTRAYALHREAFGRPIGRFQVNRHALAAAATRVTAAEALVHDTAWRLAQGEDIGAAAALEHATRTSAEVADLAVQLHGGYGYAGDLDPQRAWRDARAGLIGHACRRRRLAERGADA
jgi:alkylation response protein AidB-like acyl-CoA dehydrogenase